jgi:hypothetical protein
MSPLPFHTYPTRERTSPSEVRSTCSKKYSHETLHPQGICPSTFNSTLRTSMPWDILFVFTCEHLAKAF